MGKKNVSVIVPVYNRASEVHKCLDALVEQTYPKEQYEIIVVDDYSTDELKSVVEKYPKVQYVLNKLEFSLPAARNMGLTKAKGEIIVFLDDDAIVEKDYIKKIVEAFEKNDGIGGATGRIKDVVIHDIKKGFFGRAMAFYAKIFGISGFFANQSGVGRVLKTGFLISNFERHRELSQVKWLSGCNMSYLRKAIEDAGLFDTRFDGHSYFEDADFSYRVLKKGYTLYAVPDAVVDHQISPVSREKLSKIKYYQLIHTNRFFLKNIYENCRMKYLKHIIANWSLIFPVSIYSIYSRDPRLFWKYLQAQKVILTRVFKGLE